VCYVASAGVEGVGRPFLFNKMVAPPVGHGEHKLNSSEMTSTADFYI
jgi:hypothetical protein